MYAKNMRLSVTMHQLLIVSEAGNIVSNIKTII